MSGLLVDICYLLFLIGPVSIIVHEMGHVAGALLENARPIKMHIGRGKKCFHLQIKSIEIFVYRWYFLGGATEFSRSVPLSKKNVIITSLAGPLCNLIIAAILFLLSIRPMGEHYLLWCLFNVWLGLSNLFPYKWRGKPSDGYLVWRTVRCRDNV